MFYYYYYYNANCVIYLSPGYYCTSGVDRPDPGVNNETLNYTSACPPQSLHTGIGGLCPVGHYCPSGTSNPLPCPAGTYADREGMDACTICLQGYYCLANSSHYQDMPCQPGKFCLCCIETCTKLNLETIIAWCIVLVDNKAFLVIN